MSMEFQKNKKQMSASGRTQTGSSSDFLQKTIVVWAGALICCALWGSAFPCVKIGYRLMQIDASDTAALILFAGTRFTLAGVLAILLGSLLQRKWLVPSAKAIPKVIGLSMLQTVLQYLFFYIGLAHASGVNASIIEGLNVFVAILVAGLLFHQEQVTARKLLGCLIGFAGLVVVTLSGGSLGGLALNGEGFIFLSTLAYAFSSVVLKRLSKTENPVMLSGWQFVAGGLIMVGCGLLMGGHLNQPDPAGVGMLFWLAMVSAVAYSLWGILLKHNPISRVAVFGFMNPVFGVILSAWLLEEADSVGISAILSLLLVCIGIYICNSGGEQA